MKKDYGKLRPGDPCPKCTKGVKKKSRRTVALDYDGNAKHVPTKPVKLVHCGDKTKGHEHHCTCTKCGWINY